MVGTIFSWSVPFFLGRSPAFICSVFIWGRVFVRHLSYITLLNPVFSVEPGNLLELYVLKALPTSIELQTQGLAQLVMLNKLPGVPCTQAQNHPRGIIDPIYREGH
jgi:hypothetical protein